MTSWRRAILYGVLVWVIPFVVAFACYRLRDSWRTLFESIMPVTLAVTVVMCALSYFSRVARVTQREGILLGLLWFAISVIIDVPLMLSPPMNYTLVEYLADIGLTYAMIPVITVGVATAASRASSLLKKGTGSEPGTLND